jgi:HD superfamily phosphohydrolase
VLFFHIDKVVNILSTKSKMGKNKHEIRDVIHSFVYYNDRERAIIDSPPYQRLRDINQLGFAHFVYPGARHTRFEHSLGVMHLADRIYCTVTESNNIASEAKDTFVKELGEQRDYWRSVVKLAALCHDIGHLPYSHTAERDLFPEGVNHETILNDLLKQEQINRQFEIVPPIRLEDVIKLALGPEKAKTPFSVWEQLLSEIIVGDAFGADRIDYLLRDSYHLGVPYGHFDHHRLIDSHFEY